MRKKLLARIAYWAEHRTFWMLGIILVVTGLAIHFSQQLKLEMHFRNLMPQDHPMVKEFNQILEDYSTASMIIVAAKGREEELERFADDLAPRLKEMKNYIQRVDYKIEKEFFLQHGFMLMKAKDLENTREVYRDLNLVPWLAHLNDSFEKTYVYDEESISTKEKENNAIRMLDGIKSFLVTLDQYIQNGASVPASTGEKAAEQFLIGEEHFLSPDKQMLLIFAQPKFTVNELDKVVTAENRIDSLIVSVAQKYPSIEAGTTGTIALSRDEMEAASKDMHVTTIIAMVLIIGLFILSFRMFVAPILAGITLMVGISWAAGFAALTVHSLNIMTSMFAVVLIGLGVDFSIHIIAVYTESRAAGFSVKDSLEYSLLKSGNGIITGAFTTAFAFLTLMISKSAGMSEFGLVAGSGVLFCMISTLTVLPLLLVLREKTLLKIHKESFSVKSTEFRFMGNLACGIARRPLLVLLSVVVAASLLFLSALHLTFDYNYLNMEPVGLTSIRLQHEMENKFDVTPDYTLVTTSSVEEARTIAEAAKKLKMIGMVNSISEYVPSPEQQAKRIPLIQQIHRSLKNARPPHPITAMDIGPLLKELKRLEANLIEFAQLAFLGGQEKVDNKCKEIIGDIEAPDNRTLIDSLITHARIDPQRSLVHLNRFQNHFMPRFRQTALGMASFEPIQVESLPRSILNQFLSKDGSKYLVSIYPKEAVWNLAFLKRFTLQMQKLDKRVTGLPSIFYVLMQITARDGKLAAALAVGVIFILLLLDFRKLFYAILAMIPLLIGSIWMLGFMHLVGMQLTLVNVMGLPLILGIGMDDGVHLLHRYRVEGRGHIQSVFTSTGRAVLLTSLTTMLAFGSFKFATYRGLGSLGSALFIGVATCFLASVIVLPALLGFFEKRKKAMESKIAVDDKQHAEIEKQK